ncbi:MAG: nucleotidyltransferase domain-containing protein [Pseudomonadales bacterium]|nr:nucleotidyltransferase domain-containing protein [Candidatus Woesebacteria bacterium]MCB9802139.1 nucleotidyltransferase domain-containing protein [Pseudomonadales bacterium]
MSNTTHSNGLLQAKEAVLPVLLNYFNPHTTTIFVFGSQALGVQHDRSDIDVGYTTSTPPSALQTTEMREKLDTLPFLIDLVDFSTVSDDFKKVAKESRIVWHQAK